jgi:hypothetical protein
MALRVQIDEENSIARRTHARSQIHRYRRLATPTLLADDGDGIHFSLRSPAPTAIRLRDEKDGLPMTENTTLFVAIISSESAGVKEKMQYMGIFLIGNAIYWAAGGNRRITRPEPSRGGKRMSRACLYGLRRVTSHDEKIDFRLFVPACEFGRKLQFAGVEKMIFSSFI